MRDGRLKTAAKEAATNWPAIVTIICFTVVMCFMANSLKDGSEVKTTLIASSASFFTLFIGYAFTGKKSD